MLTAYPVLSQDDVEELRVIRNSGRQWMTRDTSEIAPEQQRAWWEHLDHAGTKVYLFRIAETSIGYGLIRLERGRVWCSLAVLPRYQGHGYGTQIYQYLALSQPQWDVYAEILADNTPSIRACLSAGFQVSTILDKHAVLVYRKNL